MGQIVVPRVNGLECSFASIEFGIDGLEIPGIKSINYKTAHDMSKARGTSSHAIGATRGDEDQDGDFEIYRRYWKQLLNKLGQGYAEIFVPMKVTYAELASPDDIHTDTCDAVKIISPEASNSQGPDALLVKCALFMLTPIAWDGKYGLAPR
jgi:hypothetical protein